MGQAANETSGNEKGDLKSKEESESSSKEGEPASTKDDSDNDSPQAMPRLQRTRPMSLPGAHSISGPGGDAESLSTRTSNSSDAERPPDSQALITSETILTATLVEERSPDSEDSAHLHVVQASPPPLARAEPVDDLPDLEAGHRTKSMQHDKSISSKPSPKVMKKRLICFTLVLSLMIIAGLTAALVYVLRDSSEDPPSKDPPSRPREPLKGFGDQDSEKDGGDWYKGSDDKAVQDDDGSH